MIMVTMMMPEPTLATSFHVSLAAKSKKKKKTHVELTISKNNIPIHVLVVCLTLQTIEP